MYDEMLREYQILVAQLESEAVLAQLTLQFMSPPIV
jgi:hypothetical protein